jgi:hypothetical protein
MKMDHVVYLDASARELDNLLAGKKSMIIRGATGRKMPYGRVFAGDILYFLNNNSEGLIRAKALVKEVLHSEALTKEESTTLIMSHQAKLLLTDNQFKRWSGKRYLVLIEVADVQEVEVFRVDKNDFGNMDDWLPVGQIDNIKLKA